MPSSGSDRKSTRLNSSHLVISYAVFCLKKKNTHKIGGRRSGTHPPIGVCSCLCHCLAKRQTAPLPLSAWPLVSRLLVFFYFFRETGAHRNLPSSPPRRSSD